MIDSMIHIASSGYEKKLHSGSWLIAATGSQRGATDASSIRTMGRHRETNEVFVLLSGEGTLVTAGFGAAPDALIFTPLQKGYLHTVRMGEWHALVLRDNAQTLIVENNGTDGTNSDQFVLSDSQQAEIRARC